MNPECRAGKHWNCNGVADLDNNGQPIPCQCVCHTPLTDDQAHRVAMLLRPTGRQLWLRPRRGTTAEDVESL